MFLCLFKMCVLVGNISCPLGTLDHAPSQRVHFLQCGEGHILKMTDIRGGTRVCGTVFSAQKPETGHEDVVDTLIRTDVRPQIHKRASAVAGSPPAAVGLCGVPLAPCAPHTAPV